MTYRYKRVTGMMLMVYCTYNGHGDMAAQVSVQALAKYCASLNAGKDTEALTQLALQGGGWTE